MGVTWIQLILYYSPLCHPLCSYILVLQAIQAGGAPESPFVEGPVMYGEETPNIGAAGTRAGDLVSFIQQSKNRESPVKVQRCMHAPVKVQRCMHACRAGTHRGMIPSIIVA